MRIQWNKNGFAELRNDPAIAGLVQDETDRLAAEMGPGYDSRGAHHPGRYRGTIVAKSSQAVRDNIKNNTMLKTILGAGGGVG